MKTVSIQTMQKQVAGLLGTQDISAWEQAFIESIAERQYLSAKQAEVLEKIWSKHFAQ